MIVGKHGVWRGIVCSVLLVCVSLHGAPRPLTPAQERDLKTFAAQLADPARSAKTKLEAAELLLARDYPEAVKVLQEFLSEPTNRPAQVAVAQGIARVGGGRKEFIAPLMAMLTGEDEAVRTEAARALATYKNHGVTGRLIEIARDRKRDQSIRLAAIRALQRVLDKSAVDTLVRLLDDRDEVIRAAAAGGLAKLTNIRAFGTSRQQWRNWWEKNKNKPRSEWLVDLADSLARSKAVLEVENVRLRDRLARAMEELYAATSPAQRDALLMSFLKDLLADVRLVGLRLIERKLGESQKVAAEARQQVAAMLADADPRVRKSAALLSANLGDPEVGKALLARMKTEQIPQVRESLLTALGQLQDPAGLEAILAECGSKHVDVAAAAARALARVASKHPLAPAVEARAVGGLIARFHQAQASDNGPNLREAVLTAMGVLRDEKFVPVLRGALADKAAVVRLAAVSGLVKFGRPELGAALAPLAEDPDRGVRQAVIAALGGLNGQKHLSIILRRADPAAEPDAAVRKQAWDAAMALLAKSDAKLLAKVVADLSDRTDAGDQRIRILQMLVDVLRREKDAGLPGALAQLAAALRSAKRPAEAAVHLAEAHAALTAAKNPAAAGVWNAWIDAMLAADDPAVAKALTDQPLAEAFGEGIKRLEARLAALADEEKWAAAIQLASAVGEPLRDRLSEAQRVAIDKALAEARAGQVAADAKRVASLAAQLVASEEPIRTAAEAGLRAMGDRAVAPLLQELRKALAAEKPGPALEKAILGVLKQIAPKLSGYDLAAAIDERIRRVDAWINGT